MKKFALVLLAALLVFGMTACGTAENPNLDQMITRAPETEPAQQQTTAATEPEETADGQETAAPAPALTELAFVADGVKLIPGEAFDASKLPEAASVYEVPSCAIEGTDNVYNYETFEVTAFNDGTGEVIYSVYLIDPNVTTPEGLALGDDVQTVVDLYGESYEVDGTAYVYTCGDVVLSIIIQGDTVASIEYRLNAA